MYFYSILSKRLTVQKLFYSVIILAFFAFSGEAFSQPPQAEETLDKQMVHGLYNDGDFEGVISGIKGFISRNETYSREDSIFIAKHLAVVYTAMPANRELGKYYMHQLLKLLPSAELVDMYVSDEIDRVFEKIRREHLLLQKKTEKKNEVEEAPAVQDRTEAQPEPEKEPVSRSRTVKEPDQQEAGETKSESMPAWKNKKYWVAGGFAVLAVGTAVILLWPEEEEGPPHYNVPQ